MTTMPYLFDLAARFTGALSRLPLSFRERHTAYVVASLQPDGGFAGRQGASNLYYAGFGLRSAQILDVSDADFWRQAANYLRKAPAGDVADIVTLLVGRWQLMARGQTLWCETCAEEKINGLHKDLLDARSPDGGFAKTKGGKSSLYHAFLAALCSELLGQEFPDRDRTVAAVLERQCSDGGFADVSGKHIEGTNPTAAAVGLLKVLGGLRAEPAERATKFVLAMQRSAGGFAAHPAAPVSDLMSTFTALVALSDAGTIRRARLGSAGRYVSRLALPAGGFLGLTGDNEPDIEYTYYGLGALALLAEQATAP